MLDIVNLDPRIGIWLSFKNQGTKRTLEQLGKYVLK